VFRGRESADRDSMKITKGENRGAICDTEVNVIERVGKDEERCGRTQGKKKSKKKSPKEKGPFVRTVGGVLTRTGMAGRKRSWLLPN